MAPNGPDRREEEGPVVWLELKRDLQALGSVAEGVGCSALQLLDAVHTQPRPLGEALLGQAGCQAVLA